MKKYKNVLIISSILTLLPLFAGLLLYDRLPEMIPTHFNLYGEPDAYSSKLFTIFGIPLFLLGLEWLGTYVTLRDPRISNVSEKVIIMGMAIVPFISLNIFVLIYAYAFNRDIDIFFYMKIILSIMFIVIGNYMPKTRPNSVVGIKLPWTLNDEENWYKTHRLTAYLYVGTGVLTLILTLIGRMNNVFFFVLVLINVIVPVLYSYLLHRSLL